MLPRYFFQLTKRQLKQKIEDALYENGELSRERIKEQLRKDLTVNFGFTHLYYEDDPYDDLADLIGYQTLSTKLTFFGLHAGDNHEHSVFFIVYWDGMRLRAYIPKMGNPWNKQTKQAYGNNSALDMLDARKNWPIEFSNATSIDGTEFDFAPKLILADIKKHLDLRPQKTTRGRKPTPKT